MGENLEGSEEKISFNKSMKLVEDGVSVNNSWKNGKRTEVKNEEKIKIGNLWWLWAFLRRGKEWAEFLNRNLDKAYQNTLFYLHKKFPEIPEKLTNERILIRYAGIRLTLRNNRIMLEEADHMSWGIYDRFFSYHLKKTKEWNRVSDVTWSTTSRINDVEFNAKKIYWWINRIITNASECEVVIK